MQHIPRRMLIAILPLSWGSGELLKGGLSAVQRGQEPSPDVSWLPPVLAVVLLMGFLCSIVSSALGPAALRRLLTVEQSLKIGGLGSVLLWATSMGYVWSLIQQNDLAAFIWQLFTGAALTLFVLIGLVLAVRAAASLAPLRTGAILLASAIGSIFVGIASWIVLKLLNDLFQPAPDILIVALALFGTLCMYLLPPLLAVGGVAALCGAAWQTPVPPHGDDVTPPAFE